MEKMNVNNNDGGDEGRRRLDSESADSVLSENDILFGFLFPHHTTGAGYPNGAVD
jgi:hypothetical protein